MTKAALLSVAVGLFVAFGVIRIWTTLEAHLEQQAARLVESEAEAARSQLAQNTDQVIAELETLRDYWSEFGRLPRYEWPNESGVDLTQIQGLIFILWDDPRADVRYAITPRQTMFDRRPESSEWQAYAAALERGQRAETPQMAGPFEYEDGTTGIEIHLPGDSPSRGSVLVARVDASRLFNHLTNDESPGYALRIQWGETLLYRRGEPAANLPESLLRNGMINGSLGAQFQVQHAPTQEMFDALSPPTVDFTLLMGLIISVLLATLTFENWRSSARARAAEVAERKLARLNRELELQVAQRTRELADRTADLQTIADSVAHDMRNPLSALSVNMELLQHRYARVLGEEGAKILARARPAIHQMADIINRMQGLSEVAHLTFERQLLDMSALVRQIFDELAAADPVPPAQLELDVLPAVEADNSLVNMLLTNLLGNSLKYSRNREVRRISVGADCRDGTTVYRVSDNGVGFESEAANSLFHPFARLRTSINSEGTGMGLAIAMRVVDRHGGKIWAEGQPDRGASFFFTLEPAASADS